MVDGGAEARGEDRSKTYDFDLYLSQARYLTDYQWRRSGSFEARAMALLSTDAVLLALVASLLDPDRLAAWGIAAALTSAAMFLASALVAVVGLYPRKVGAPDVCGFRDSYLEYRSAPTDPRPATEEQLAGSLIGPPGHPPILRALAEDATRRGRAVAGSAVLLLVGMAALGVTFSNVLLEGR